MTKLSHTFTFSFTVNKLITLILFSVSRHEVNSLTCISRLFLAASSALDSLAACSKLNLDIFQVLKQIKVVHIQNSSSISGWKDKIHI